MGETKRRSGPVWRVAFDSIVSTASAGKRTRSAARSTGAGSSTALAAEAGAIHNKPSKSTCRRRRVFVNMVVDSRVLNSLQGSRLWIAEAARSRIGGAWSLTLGGPGQTDLPRIAWRGKKSRGARARKTHPARSRRCYSTRRQVNPWRRKEGRRATVAAAKTRAAFGRGDGMDISSNAKRRSNLPILCPGPAGCQVVR